jgi:hypothetical protein
MTQIVRFLEGFAPKEIKPQDEVKLPRNIVIPEKIFEEFKELTMENEPEFKFMAFYATCSILEKVTDDFWSLEFPSCISSEGRPFLYKVASYFGLAHHT